jgi:hypothetical protein
VKGCGHRTARRSRPDNQTVTPAQTPTKEARRLARQQLEALEAALRTGPGLQMAQIRQFAEFLRAHGFAPNSSYFVRLAQIEAFVRSHPAPPDASKRDYAGYAAGCWMQVQSVYDHVILSVCYEGEFRGQRGRIKISHRFNRAGRLDFVEAKLLRSLVPLLDGALRKLLTVREFPSLRPDWWTAGAYALRVLPRELLFLHPEIFRYPREQILAWLVNIGHRTVADLVAELEPLSDTTDSRPRGRQWPVACLRRDAVAWPILQQAALLEASVDPGDSPDVFQIRYLRRLPVPDALRREAVETA